MTLTKNLINVGNANILTFQDEGKNINHEPIESIFPLVAINLSAGSTYSWNFADIKKDIRPLTLWGQRSTSIANNDNFYIRVYQNGQLIWQLNLSGKKNLFETSFCFDFPYCVLSSNHSVIIESAVALDQVLILAKECYLNSIIPPTT